MATTRRWDCTAPCCTVGGSCCCSTMLVTVHRSSRCCRRKVAQRRLRRGNVSPCPGCCVLTSTACRHATLWNCCSRLLRIAETGDAIASLCGYLPLALRLASSSCWQSVMTWRRTRVRVAVRTRATGRWDRAAGGDGGDSGERRPAAIRHTVRWANWRSLPAASSRAGQQRFGTLSVTLPRVGSAPYAKTARQNGMTKHIPITCMTWLGNTAATVCPRTQPDASLRHEQYFLSDMEAAKILYKEMQVHASLQRFERAWIDVQHAFAWGARAGWGWRDVAACSGLAEKTASFRSWR